MEEALDQTVPLKEIDLLKEDSKNEDTNKEASKEEVQETPEIPPSF